MASVAAGGGSKLAENITATFTGSLKVEAISSNSDLIILRDTGNFSLYAVRRKNNTWGSLVRIFNPVTDISTGLVNRFMGLVLSEDGNIVVFGNVESSTGMVFLQSVTCIDTAVNIWSSVKLILREDYFNTIPTIASLTIKTWSIRPFIIRNDGTLLFRLNGAYNGSVIYYFTANLVSGNWSVNSNYIYSHTYRHSVEKLIISDSLAITGFNKTAAGLLSTQDTLLIIRFVNNVPIFTEVQLPVMSLISLSPQGVPNKSLVFSTDFQYLFYCPIFDYDSSIKPASIWVCNCTDINNNTWSIFSDLNITNGGIDWISINSDDLLLFGRLNSNTVDVQSVVKSSNGWNYISSFLTVSSNPTPGPDDWYKAYQYSNTLFLTATRTNIYYNKFIKQSNGAWTNASTNVPVQATFSNNGTLAYVLTSYGCDLYG